MDQQKLDKGWKKNLQWGIANQKNKQYEEVTGKRKLSLAMMRKLNEVLFVFTNQS